MTTESGRNATASPRIGLAARRPWYSLTTRRSLLLIAGFALIFSMVHGAPKPGLYATVGRYCLGACRDNLDARWTYANGDPGGYTYQLGIWKAGTSGWIVAGLELKDRKIIARASTSYFIIF